MSEKPPTQGPEDETPTPLLGGIDGPADLHGLDDEQPPVVDNGPPTVRQDLPGALVIPVTDATHDDVEVAAGRNRLEEAAADE